MLLVAGTVAPLEGGRQSYNFLFKASGALFAASFTAVYRVLGQKADH
jgi:hypothetical protein